MSKIYAKFNSTDGAEVHPTVESTIICNEQKNIEKNIDSTARNVGCQLKTSMKVSSVLNNTTDYIIKDGSIQNLKSDNNDTFYIEIILQKKNQTTLGQRTHALRKSFIPNLRSSSNRKLIINGGVSTLYSELANSYDLNESNIAAVFKEEANNLVTTNVESSDQNLIELQDYAISEIILSSEEKALISLERISNIYKTELDKLSMEKENPLNSENTNKKIDNKITYFNKKILDNEGLISKVREGY